jgi:hypothetical protein
MLLQELNNVDELRYGHDVVDEFHRRWTWFAGH